MSVATYHRLEGLEPDNLLAFLALLGLLRALETSDLETDKQARLAPRVLWSVDQPPLRPVLTTARPTTPEEICELAANGIGKLAPDYKMESVETVDLRFTVQESREILRAAAEKATCSQRGEADLWAALMTDGAIKDEKESTVEPTPLCLLFGQGHQHFLDRLRTVPGIEAPPPRGRGKAAQSLSASQCLEEALFCPWQRKDPTPSFRWDPDEDVRYALMAGDPTDSAYKSGTQHGANRLAVIGLAVLPAAPKLREARDRRIRATLLGGLFGDGGFSFAWPIWRDPASLSSIRALLSHPKLRKQGALAYMGIEHVLEAKRISVGKFMNFTRGREIVAE